MNSLNKQEKKLIKEIERLDSRSWDKPGDKESKLEEIAEELQLIIPKSHKSMGVRVVALLSLVGGVGILSAAITDIFSYKVSFIIRLASGATGFIFLAIAYGLIKKRRWAIWLWGLVSLVAAFSNPASAIILVAIFVYLWIKREDLRESPLDYWLEKKYEKIKEWLVGKN